jgi:methionine-rich copper-binding protein CopC
VIWVGNYFQVGIEAIIPVNRQTGSGVGVIAQLHLYLDDIDPRGIGRPIFGSAPPPAKTISEKLTMRTLFLIATLGLPLLGIGDAAAHAFLDHASPRVGTAVSAAPREVTLWFTQKLEAAFSGVRVTNAAGQRVISLSRNVDRADDLVCWFAARPNRTVRRSPRPDVRARFVVRP